MNILQETTNQSHGSLTRGKKKYGNLKNNENTPRTRASAYRSEMARLHESVVDLKMKLATAQAKFQTNKGNIENGGNENTSIEESIKLQEALNDRVKALSHDLLKAEAKNRKLRRLLENSKKKADEKISKRATKAKTAKEKRKKSRRHASTSTGDGSLGSSKVPKSINDENSQTISQQQQALTPVTKRILNNNRNKNDENIDSIQEVRVYKWKEPPIPDTNTLDLSEFAEDSFAKAGTGESVLDRLPNDVLQDVLLKYWHNNHEYKFSRSKIQEANKDINNTCSENDGSTQSYESKYEEGNNDHEYHDENNYNYNYSTEYANEEVDGQYDYGNAEAMESAPYESNATTDHGAWEENYAYNADGYVDENYETAATVDGNEYTQAQSEDNEYHEEQGEFTEGTESPEYEESIVIDGEIHYMNDEWKEWSQKQHQHNPKYTVMEWFEWGVKHYFLGDEAEDDDEEEDQAYNEQQDYYAEYDYENQDGEKNSEYVEENTEYLFTACRNGKFEELKKMVRSGLVNVNAMSRDNKTLLMIASQSNNRKACKILLRNNADPNICDSNGNNALYYALKFGYKSICKLLIDAGSDAPMDMKPKPRVLNRLLPPHMRDSNIKFKKK